MGNINTEIRDELMESIYAKIESMKMTNEQLIEVQILGMTWVEMDKENRSISIEYPDMVLGVDDFRTSITDQFHTYDEAKKFLISELGMKPS